MDLLLDYKRFEQPKLSTGDILHSCILFLNNYFFFTIQFLMAMHYKFSSDILPILILESQLILDCRDQNEQDKIFSDMRQAKAEFSFRQEREEDLNHDLFRISILTGKIKRKEVRRTINLLLVFLGFGICIFIIEMVILVNREVPPAKALTIMRLTSASWCFIQYSFIICVIGLGIHRIVKVARRSGFL